MLRLRSFRTKLQTAFVLLGLCAIAVTGWEASADAAAALRSATYERLTAIAETKRQTIERYFEDAGDHVLALSTDEGTIAALEAFQPAWDRIPEARETSDLRRFYDELFAATGAGDAAPWFPTEARTQTLQKAFLSGSPYPAGSRQLLLTAPSTGPYSAIHARIHPTLHRYQSAFGCYDIFLIDASSSRILYTVLKEIDLGMRLNEPPYRDTGLARVFRRAVALTEPESYVIEDYQPYAPSMFAPAAFLAAPVWRRGVVIGVLAIQLSVRHLNQVMTSDRKWQAEGLGRTGHSYIAGADGTLRSDIRFEIERPDEFLRELKAAGVPAAAVERIRRHRTAILNLSVPPDLRASIERQQRGTHEGKDFRGTSVLRSHLPLEIAGLNWHLIAEIEAAEALAAVRDLRRNTLLWGAVIGAVFLLAAALLARSVTQPLVELARTAERIGHRDFEARVRVESDDEIGKLAEAFNHMSEELRRTTVSKSELEALAGRLISAQEEERARVARELHDDLTQRLAALAIEIGRLERTGAGSAQLATVKQHVVQLSRDVHGLSRRLHPAMIEDLGLVAALEAECRSFFERGGPPVEFRHEGSFEDAGFDAQLGAYRIVQEALRNVARHAAAQQVVVSLRRAGGEILLEVSDDGEGFDRTASSWRPGVGLASMEERARLLGGRCTIHSRPGAGTRIEARVPVHARNAEAQSSAGR